MNLYLFFFVLGVCLWQKTECMVSVLCTAYNHEKYIAQTLQCIVDQQTDFAPFELLVNDDRFDRRQLPRSSARLRKNTRIIAAFYQEKELLFSGNRCLSSLSV